jgi:hypothetical protein
MSVQTGDKIMQVKLSPRVISGRIVRLTGAGPDRRNVFLQVKLVEQPVSVLQRLRLWNVRKQLRFFLSMYLRFNRQTGASALSSASTNYAIGAFGHRLQG